MIQRLTWEADGTRYRLVVWVLDGLNAHGLQSAADARNVAAALASVWGTLTGNDPGFPGRLAVH